MSQMPCAIASMEVPPHAHDAISARNEQQSQLLCLPAELRNEIYTRVFGGLIWEYRSSDKSRARDSVLQILGQHHEEVNLAMRGTRRHLALLMTCRSVHAEAATIPFSINKFLFEEDRMAEFVRALTADQRTAINTVQIKISWEVRKNFPSIGNIPMPLSSLPSLKRVEVDIREEWKEIVRVNWLRSPRYRLTKDDMKEYVKYAVLCVRNQYMGRDSRGSRDFALVEDEVEGYLREAVQYGGNAETKRIISFGTDKRDKLQ